MENHTTKRAILKIHTQFLSPIRHVDITASQLNLGLTPFPPPSLNKDPEGIK